MATPQVAPATLDTLRGFAKAGLLPPGDVQAIVRQFQAEAGPALESLLTVKTAAQRLGCCGKTVLRLADEGRLARVYMRPGVRKTLRFRASELDAIMVPAPLTMAHAPDSRFQMAAPAEV